MDIPAAPFALGPQRVINTLTSSASSDEVSTTGFAPTTNATREFADVDVLRRFGPSRIPPLVALRLETSRNSIVSEIKDLLIARSYRAHAAIEISRGYPRFRHLPRGQSTMVAKREAANRYKDRLCVRGDMIPLLDVGLYRPHPFTDAARNYSCPSLLIADGRFAPRKRRRRAYKSTHSSNRID